MNNFNSVVVSGEQTSVLEARLRTSDFRWRQHLLRLWDLQRQPTS